MDFTIQDSGSIILFNPVSDRARQHFDEFMPDDCPMMGASYAVERRYAIAIYRDLVSLGFVMQQI